MSFRRKVVTSVLTELGYPSHEYALGEITLLNAATLLAQYEEGLFSKACG